MHFVSIRSTLYDTYKENYLKVVKKNQQVSDWDFDKILKAVNKSAKRVSKKLSEPQEQE